MHGSFSHNREGKKKKDFFSFFPVPEFLLMRTFGFDISDDSLKVVELVEKNGLSKVGFFNSSSIPDGMIKSGQILNHTGFVDVVAEVQRKHKFRFVNASLPEQESYLYTTLLPAQSRSSLRETIEFHLEENIPLSKKEVVFDFAISGTHKKEGKKYKQLAVSAVPLSVSEEYSSLLKRAGLRPLSLTTEAEALAHAIIPRGDKETYMIVDLGGVRTGVSVVSDGATKLASTIEVGGRHITELISRDLSIPYEEAEARKHSIGLSYASGDLRVPDIVRERLTSITREVSEQMRYWDSRSDEREIHERRVSKIFLCGGGALTVGIEAFFEKALSMPVELADVWSNVSFPQYYVPEITFEDSLSFATAIGLALRK